MLRVSNNMKEMNIFVYRLVLAFLGPAAAAAGATSRCPDVCNCLEDEGDGYFRIRCTPSTNDGDLFQAIQNLTIYSKGKFESI